ncbi:MAG: LPS assembly protein LptD, partial [Pseudomonadota bacterium]|nr:LPS assembly protein LptD [Pseudomonadota bacterium]
MMRHIVITGFIICMCMIPLHINAQSLNDEQALIEAESMSYVQDTEIVTASGDVKIQYRGRELRAGKITWDQKSDRIIARDNVILIDADGSSVTSQSAELQDEMKQATLKKFSLMMKNNLRFKGETASREFGKLTSVRKSIFTACKPCKINPDASPTWQLRSGQTVYDEKDETISHKNVRLEMRGVPVFYLPYLTHPAPNVKKRSGFLFPIFKSSTDTGADVALPYFINLAPDYDLTLSPRYISDGSSMLGFEWRQKTSQGTYNIAGNGLWLDEEDNLDNDKTFRGNIQSKGAFKLSENWQAGYDYWWVSDKSFMRRYDINEDDFFTSKAYIRQTNGRNMVDVRLLDFNTSIFNIDEDVQPEVAPQIRTEHYFDNLAGGELRVTSDIVSMSQKNGADLSRAVAETEWNRQSILKSGQILDYFGGVRGAYYDYVTDSGEQRNKDEESVLLAHTGIKWRMPFIKRQASGAVIIEPTAQIIIANEETSEGTVPNEDSLSSEFDSLNLFDVYRHTGYDRFDTGNRFDVGVNTVFEGDKGSSYRMFVGKSYRDKALVRPTIGTEQDAKASDWLLDISFEQGSALGFNGQLRFDDDDQKLIRSDGEIYASIKKAHFSLHYSHLDASITPDGFEREEARGSFDFSLFENWLLNGNVRYDMEREKRLKNSIGLIYRDDCT